MNESVHKRYVMKVDLILQAAKNVLDDPSIDFDTPEGAKETLVEEIARIKKWKEIHEDFDRSMKLFDEACQKYGYQKRKDGSYHLPGDPVLAIGKVGRYINEHWFDDLKNEGKENS